MKLLYALPLLATFAMLYSKVSPPAAPAPAVNVMAYYVPAEDYLPDDLPLDQLTHIIFSFTNVIDGKMQFRTDSVTGAILRRLVARRDAEFPDLKVMVACGGWTADGFSDMALNDSTRTRFAESAAAFVERYDLDGMDMDWEYPGIGEAGIVFRPEDTRNFTLTLKALREHLDALGRPQTLTFASAGWEQYYDFIELDEVMRYADFMNVMTYDLITYVSPYTGHHTNQGEIAPADLEGTPYGDWQLKQPMVIDGKEFTWHPRSVEYIVDYCINRGVDPGQIVTGAAFYGRSWKGVGPRNHGLYQPVGGSHIGWCAYREIRDQYENKNGFVRYWDSTAQAPFLYSAADSIFFTYDDTTSVRLKAEYAMEKQLGGVMFWELGNDTKEEESLLHAIYRAVTR